MTQRMYPNADYSNTGGWTGTSGLYTSVDEVTASDTDYVSSPASPTSGQTLDLSLSDPIDPSFGASDSTLSIRARKSGGKTANLSYKLLNSGGTAIVTRSVNGLPTSFAQTNTTESSNAWSAGDLANARVELAGSVSGGGSPTTIDVSWLEFIIPNPPPPPAPTSLTATPGDTTMHLSWGDYSSPDRTGYFVLQDGVEIFRFSSSLGSFQNVASLTNGTAYDFEVGFSGPGGDGSTSLVTATPHVQPPTGLTGTPGNGSVQLDWTQSASATGHKIYRDSVLIDTIGAVATYTDSTVTNETTYSYEVSSLDSVDSGYESATAGPVDVTPTAAVNYYPSATHFESGWDSTSGGTASICLDASLLTYLYANDGPTTAEVGFPDITDPGDYSTGARTRLECLLDSSSVGITITLTLSTSADGAIHIETINHFGSGYFVSVDLTQAELDAITDWTDLTLTVAGSWGTGVVQVYYARLAVVDGSSGPNIAPAGLSSAEAFGTAVLTTGPVDVSPSGLATTEAFGTATVTAPPPTQGITVSGIASTEACGTAVLTTGPVTVTPSGISSAGAFGSATLTTGPVDLAPTGIATAAAFGSATLTTTVTITASGIASAEAHGSTTVAPGPVDIAATGIASTEALGNPIVSVSGGPQFVVPGGIGSANAFGTTTVTPGPVTINPSGIASTEAVGSATVTPGAADIAPPGLSSAEAFGTTTVAGTGGAQNLTPTGIASAESFGTAVVTPGPVGISVTGISSAEAFGAATVTPGAVSVSPVGIAAPVTDELAALGFNGDFETDLSGWVVAGTPGATISRDTTTSHSGSASLKFVHNGGGLDEADNSATAFANGAGAKRATVWMKASNDETVDVYFYSGEADADWSHWVLTNVAVTTSWAEYTFDYDQVGSKFTAIDFDRKDVYGALPGAALWIDSITVEGIPEVTTGPPDQDIAPGRGITTGLEFGTPTVLAEQELVTQGIPSGELFGGPVTVTHQVFIASAPSYREAPSGREYPFRRVELERGITVYVIDGVYYQIQRPLDDLVADEIYFGGRDYEVTAAKATELEAQGFRIRTEIR